MNIVRIFDKKWENKIEQLEPGSTDGVISLAEFRIRTEASTVATSSGGGGSHVGVGIPGGQAVWLPSRTELKGWWVWSRIRETGLTVEKGKELVGQVKSSLHFSAWS